MGRPGELPVAGDWDGDGRDTPAIYRRPEGTADLLDAQGVVTDRVHLGGAESGPAFPVAGDWYGDGIDTLGLYLPDRGVFVLHHDHGSSTTLSVGPLPGADALPVAGDWNGDGSDTVGLYLRARGEFLLYHQDGTTTARLGPAGTSDTFPVAGDWNGDGHDTVGIYRRSRSTFLVDDRDLGVPAPADGGIPSTGPREVAFGRPGQVDALPLAGDWNGRDLVTLEDLRQIYDLRDADSIAESLPFLNAAMLQAGATTPARKAAFVATLRNESGFRADAVEPGHAPYRGRGLIQLTGAANYRQAGAELGLDLVGEPELAANPLVSAAVASWYWTAARDINQAADRMDMAAVGIAVGYAPTSGEDAERCRDFVAALQHFDPAQPARSVNCERTPLSYLLALAAPPGSDVAARPAGDLGADGSPMPAAPSTPGTLEPVEPAGPPLARDEDAPSSDRPGRPAPPPPSTTTSTVPSPSTTTTSTVPPPPSTTTSTVPPPSTTTSTVPPPSGDLVPTIPPSTTVPTVPVSPPPGRAPSTPAFPAEPDVEVPLPDRPEPWAPPSPGSETPPAPGPPGATTPPRAVSRESDGDGSRATARVSCPEQV
jgi:putative chitinase